MFELISIIVPIYNVEKYLMRCLESISQQKYKRFEVLLIDDGSTDNSSIIAKHFQASDERFKYFYQLNAGISAARNKGISESKGKYLCFVDSDDYIHQDYIRILYKTISQSESDIVSCRVARVNESGRIVNYRVTNGDKIGEVKDIHKYLENTSFSCCNKIYKRRLFDGLRFPERIKYEDFALMPQIYAKAKKITIIPDIMYFYCYRENSITATSLYNLDMLKAHAILEKSIISKSYPDVLCIYYVRQIMGSLLWQLFKDYNSNRKQINEILLHGKNKYNDIDNYIQDRYIGKGKAIWGKLIIQGRFVLAKIYFNMYEILFSVAKFLKKKILQI